MNYQKRQKTSANEGMDIFVFLEGLWKLTKIFFEITQNAISNIAQKSTLIFSLCLFPCSCSLFQWAITCST